MSKVQSKFPLRILCALCSLLFFNTLFAQDTTTCKFLTPSSEYNRKRFLFIEVSTATVYTGAIYGLYQLWYKDYPLVGFHFFNDNREWNQVDKIGHAYTAYAVGKAGIDFVRWAGVKDNKAIWMGGSLGFIYMTTIEILDGFSLEWGASPGDLIANTSGSLLAISQELAWKEQRIFLKFSSHKVDYSGFSAAHQQRAKELYGTSFSELTLKDYNGQTYWLSVNIASFLKKDARFPGWLNLSFGYGSEQMFCGHEEDCKDEPWAYPERYRQYYISLDADLTKIKTRSHLLKTLFSLFNIIKVPAPALELNEYGKWKGHWIYF